jgi:hypothetical protein
VNLFACDARLDGYWGCTREGWSSDGICNEINVAFAVLAGFEIQYNNGDHHVLQEQIQVDVNGLNPP